MLRTQGHNCTDKQWFINKILRRIVCFQRKYKQIRLARFARSQSCIHFLQFLTCWYKSSLIGPSWYHNITEPTWGLIVPTKIFYLPTKHWEESPVSNAKYENFGSLRSLAISYMFSVRYYCQKRPCYQLSLKNWWLCTIDPRKGLCEKFQRENSFYHCWRSSSQAFICSKLKSL